MTNKRLPPDALAYYISLGVKRSYSVVAAHFGVSKTAVVNRAQEENWQAEVERAEEQTRRRTVEAATETLEELNDRHLKMLRVIQRKALDALKAMPLTRAMEAVRALDLTIKHERLIRGEPTEKTAAELEALIIREHDRWLVETDEEDEQEGGSAAPANQ